MIKIIGLFCIGMLTACSSVVKDGLVVPVASEPSTIQYFVDAVEVTIKVLVVDPDLLQKPEPIVLQKSEPIVLQDIVVTAEIPLDPTLWWFIGLVVILFSLVIVVFLINYSNKKK